MADNTQMNCKVCGTTFFSGDLVRDVDKMIELQKERGGYYCEQHSQKNKNKKIKEF